MVLVLYCKMGTDVLFKRFKTLSPFWSIVPSKIRELSFPVTARDTEVKKFNNNCEEFNKRAAECWSFFNK